VYATFGCIGNTSPRPRPLRAALYYAEIEIWAYSPTFPVIMLEVAAGKTGEMVSYNGGTTAAMATDGDVYDLVATTSNAQTWMWAYWDLGTDMPIDVVSVLSRPHFINCLSYCE